MVISWLCLAIVLGSTGPLPYASQNQPATQSAGIGTVVSLSDIHFNPYYDPTLITSLIRADYTKWKEIFSSSSVQGDGDHTADTNYNLFNSALQHVQRIAPHPDFIIISGDFLAHDFGQTFSTLSKISDPQALDSFVDKTIAFVTMMIAERFPTTPVYPALGNNDSYCGDYELQPGGQFLKATAQTWKRLFKDPANADAFMQTFPTGGYYSIIAPNNKNHRVIVLNTVFFSYKYKDACSNPPTDPAPNEMQWLQTQLQQAAAKNEQVWLLYHIPPGIDVYSTLKKNPGGHITQTVSYWNPSYNQQFIDLVSQYSPVIVASFAGHTHMDSFQLVCQAINKRAASFVHITPAISPLFGNNPGFKIFTYDRQSSTLNDYAVHYLNIGVPSAPPTWAEEYKFAKAYGQPSLNPLSLQAIYNLMLINYDDDLTKYSKYYNVGNTASPAITETNWPAYWCGIGSLTGSQFINWDGILTSDQGPCSKNKDQ
jgi:hypothetical protein